MEKLLTVCSSTDRIMQKSIYVCNWVYVFNAFFAIVQYKIINITNSSDEFNILIGFSYFVMKLIFLSLWSDFCLCYNQQIYKQKYFANHSFCCSSTYLRQKKKNKNSYKNNRFDPIAQNNWNRVHRTVCFRKLSAKATSLFVLCWKRKQNIQMAMTTENSNYH